MGSEEPSAAIDFFAGWCSGAVSVLVIQPLDTILTRLQAAPALSGASTIGSSTVSLHTRGLVSNSGISALWRGSSAMITAVPMQNALLMGGYGIGKSWNEKTSAQDQALLSNVFIGGCVGGLAQSFLMSPVELIKVQQQVRLQSASSAGKEVLQGLVSPSRSWRGLNATIMRDGVPHGVWFASYEWTKNKLAIQFEGTSGEKMTVPLLSGAVAATVAWGVGYPFDIIKTRIQASGHGSNKGIYATAAEIVAESNGRFSALYRGFGLKLVRSIPASMIGFTVYELVADQLK